MTRITIPWWRASFGEDEISAIGRAIRNEHISMGPLTRELEAKFANLLKVQHAVVFPSGSVALFASMMALGIRPNDEVIMPDRTWVATANAPMMLGARPVLVDVRAHAPLIDVSRIEKKITKKTKIILPVHLSGRDSDMKAIMEIAEKHNLAVVEDACQALFSRSKSGLLGTMGDIGCFSLGVTKLISTGQGGIATTNNRATAEKLRLIRSNGTLDNINPKYTLLGCNFKFTDMQAAMGIVQLSKSREKIRHLNGLYGHYTDGLGGLDTVKIVPVDIRAGEVPLYFDVLCKDRDRLAKYLSGKGIETRPALPGLHIVPYIKSSENFSNADVFSSQGLVLPCGTAQPPENVERAIRAIRKFKN